MLDSYFRSFLYRFFKGPEAPPYQLDSMGWQVVTSASYDWHGMKRPEEKGHCIFQYTLSGTGKLILSGREYVLNKGDAFLVKIPCDSHYFLPQNSNKWEFLFIVLTGDAAEKYWDKVSNSSGDVIKLTPSSEVINYLWKIYFNSVNKIIQDGFEASSEAYNFIMMLEKSINSTAEEVQMKYRNSINSSLEFINENFSLGELTLDMLAEKADMSKYHYTRIFSKVTGTSPWEYIIKLRLQKSMEFLLNENLSIDEISKKVGFSGANYFCKVFKRYLNTSPGKFRVEHFGYSNYSVKL